MKITSKPILLVDDDHVDVMTVKRSSGAAVKPVSYLRFVEVMRSIDAYWTTSEIPQ